MTGAVPPVPAEALPSSAGVAMTTPRKTAPSSTTTAPTAISAFWRKVVRDGGCGGGPYVIGAGG
ncbi:hypothetical protein E1211_07350 [Micromonospora sp. 15K316]|nr:hypothetical protein E1211_07350 [Micromonospora sp. 15K316]